MANVLSADKQQMALNMLVEGSSLRSVTRLTGIHRTTVMNLLVRFGDACRQFLDEEMRGLTLDHVEVMVRENRTKGFFISFDFTRDALTEVNSFFKKTGKVIVPLTVREILDEELAKKLA